jgi:hypothetical protein
MCDIDVTRFLVNVMFRQFNLMFFHIKVVFSYFGYQFLQGFSNNSLDKNGSSLLHIHIQMFFLFQLIHSKLWIFPISNSLLICKHVEKTNYQNDKQEHLIFIAISIKAMLLFKPSGHEVNKWYKHYRILRLCD